jgi:hypothetical protein
MTKKVKTRQVSMKALVIALEGQAKKKEAVYTFSGGRTFKERA